MPTSLQIVNDVLRRRAALEGEAPRKVKKVVDAKKEVEIEIVARDVTSALRQEHSSCVVAEALVRCLHVDAAVVSTRTAFLITGDTATRYEVPERVSREIVAFDRGAQFMPGKYKLNPVRKRRPRGSGTRHPGKPDAGKIKHRATEGIRTRLQSVGVENATRVSRRSAGRREAAARKRRVAQ